MGLDRHARRLSHLPGDPPGRPAVGDRGHRLGWDRRLPVGAAGGDGVRRGVRHRRDGVGLRRRRIHRDGRHPPADRDRRGDPHRPRDRCGDDGEAGPRLRQRRRTRASARRCWCDGQTHLEVHRGRPAGGAGARRRSEPVRLHRTRTASSTSPNRQGFLETADDHAFGDAPLGDYGANLGGTDRVSTAVAGVVGVAVTLAVGWGLFRLLARRRDDRTSTPASGQG